MYAEKEQWFVFILFGVISVVGINVLLAERDIRSFNASLAKLNVISLPVNCEFAITLRKAPSSSLTFDCMHFAMKNATSVSKFVPIDAAFFCKIATRVSSSGGSMD